MYIIEEYRGLNVYIRAIETRLRNIYDWDIRKIPYARFVPTCSFIRLNFQR